MQEWIIAMLVISVLLIVRDMAKTILSGKGADAEEIMPASDGNPQKSGHSVMPVLFRSWQTLFTGCRTERLPELRSGGAHHRGNQRAGVSEVLSERCVLGKPCGKLFRRPKALSELWRGGDEEALLAAKSDWMGGCGRSGTVSGQRVYRIPGEMQELVWDNRLIENRLAIAQQLSEVSRIMGRHGRRDVRYFAGRAQISGRAGKGAEEAACGAETGLGHGQV